MPSLAGQDEGSVSSAISHINLCSGLQQRASLIVPAQHMGVTCIFTDGLPQLELAQPPPPEKQALPA